MRLPEGRSTVRTLGAAALACAVALAVLWPAFILGRVPAFGDNVSFWAPSTAFWKAEVAAGRFPLWNPCILGGIPFAADINHGVFYPPAWIAVVTSIPTALAVLAFFHIALAVFGMYLFLTSEKVPAPAALWGGVIFAISAAFLSLVNHIVMLESMSYLPLVLFFASRLAGGGGVKTALGCGIALGLSALAGDVHATYIAVLAAGAYLVVKCLTAVLGGNAKQAARMTALFALAGTAALLLAAAGVLPAAELVGRTARDAGSRAYAAYHSLDTKAAVSLVAPDFLGSLRDGTAWNFRWENAIYLGVPLVMLAACSLRGFRRAIPAVVLVGVGAGLAFAHGSPLWHLAYRAVPAFKMFRQPREYFIIAVVGVILLAAHALGDLLSAPEAKRADRRIHKPLLVAAASVTLIAAVVFAFSGGIAKTLAGRLPTAAGQGVLPAGCIVGSLAVAGLGFGLVLFAFSIRRLAGGGKIAAAVVALLVVADVGLSSRGRLVYGPRTLYEGATAAAGAVRARTLQASAWRFVPVGPGFAEYFGSFASRAITGQMPGEARSFENAKRVKLCLCDDEALYTGLRSAIGYSTFVPKHYGTLYEIATGQKASPVRLKGLSGADWRLLGAGALLEHSRDYRASRIRTLESPDTISMAYRWRRAGSFEDATALLRANPTGALSCPVVEAAKCPVPMAEGLDVLHSIEDIRRTTGSLSFVVYTDSAGLLVVMESYYPGWRASDNGVEADIHPVNVAWRGIFLSPGRHEVRFVFRPKIVYAGVAVSLAAVIGILAVFVITAVAGWRK